MSSNNDRWASSDPPHNGGHSGAADLDALVAQQVKT